MRMISSRFFEKNIKLVGVGASTTRSNAKQIIHLSYGVGAPFGIWFRSDRTEPLNLLSIIFFKVFWRCRNLLFTKGSDPAERRRRQAAPCISVSHTLPALLYSLGETPRSLEKERLKVRQVLKPERSLTAVILRSVCFKRRQAPLMRSELT